MVFYISTTQISMNILGKTDFGVETGVFGVEASTSPIPIGSINYSNTVAKGINFIAVESVFLVGLGM